MKFKTELHLHSSPASPCAELTPQEIAARYISYGYSTVVLTNHYTACVNDSKGETWQERVDYFLRDFHALKEAANGKLNVLLGCEIRFPQNTNDYLVLGLTEEFLRAHPDIYTMNVRSFSAFARENGLLFIQAHPFRNDMTVVRPELLDGVEVFNGHHKHHSRNNIANAWAKQYGLIRTSGTDFHHPEQYGVGGIATDAPITSHEELISTLKSGDYTILCSGPAAERDGMQDMRADD